MQFFNLQGRFFTGSNTHKNRTLWAIFIGSISTLAINFVTHFVKVS